MDVNQKKPLVSIIVPVYKTEEYLDQCVQSLLGQTYEKIEIILVDDGSPDSCPVLCDGYAQRDSRVKVVHKCNEGAAFARKAGIVASSGQYLLMVDSDDWLDVDTVACCVETALRDDAGCVQFSYIKEYPNKSIENPLFEANFSYDETTSEAKIHRRLVGLLGRELCHPEKIDNLSTVWMKLYRADVARRGRIVSERVVGTSEDTIFNLYALEGCRVSYVNRCFYHYRKSNAQSITTQYKADLAEKWDVLYQIFQEYIDGSGRAEEYQPAFLNRVACGMIGLGLNEISSPVSIWKKAKRLRMILKKPLYAQAFRQLDISPCPLKWKVFFLLCRYRAALILALLLGLMNRLRSRMAA
ncbi:glycosyltransferase family 2 protein [Dysosmobacter sp. Sow4_B12]|uniref:glycosyltransferase family 2 protein n=1 Tax=Dysosmobacter sp. Sow4_B12 TaxID=3438777 RepID=UPI003F8E3007